MTPTTINDLFSQAISTATGGIVTDVQTVIIALIVIFFLMVGLGKLKETFENVLQDRQGQQPLTGDHKETDSSISKITRD